MVKIELNDAAAIEDWYAGEVMPIIKDRIICHSASLHNAYAKSIVLNLDDDALRALLTMKITDLANKYFWAKEYYEVACFVCEFGDLTEYLKEFYRTCGYKHHKLVSEYQKEREEYLQKFAGNRIIDKVKKHKYSSYTYPDEEICRSNKNMEEFIGYVSEEFDKINADLGKIINYDFLDSNSGSGKKSKNSVRAEYVKRLDIRVCPYCNQQYIYHFGDGRYLGDLDHIRPKSKFALFSMSMYNLVPACKPCNQLFKKSSTKQILNPYEEGFGDDAHLHLNYKSVREMAGIDPVSDMKWCVNRKLKRYPDRQKNKVLCHNMENAIGLFELDAVYKGHSDEIQLALKRRYDYDPRYRKCVTKLTGISGLMDPRILYGVSFDEKKYQNELMAKAINDVVRGN